MASRHRPVEQRQAILLIGLEGMRYDEAAVVMGVPIGTVRSRLSRGRELLRKLFEGEESHQRASTHREKHTPDKRSSGVPVV